MTCAACTKRQAARRRGDANKLRISGNTVVNLLERPPDTEQKKAAIEALKKYLAKTV